MNNKYYLATVLLVLGAFSPLYGVQNTPHNYSVKSGDIRFTGTVIDEAGIPVIGANILVKGTTNGTITDMDGRFTLINVPEKRNLGGFLYRISRPRTIPVAGKSTLKSV